MSDKTMRLLGLEKQSEFVGQSLENSDMRSGLCMGLIVAVYELLSFITLTTIKDSISERLMQVRIVGSMLMFAVSLFVVITGYMYIKGKALFHNIRYVSKCLFTLAAIAYGITTAYIDYIDGEQMLVFVTMMLFAVGLYVWKPIISLLILGTSFTVMFSLLNTYSSITSTTLINGLGLLATLAVYSCIRYYQMRLDAENDEEREEVNAHLRKINNIDDVTGVANMRFFVKSSAEIMKEDGVKPESRVFLFADIENFKAFNEKFGFGAGNAFLIKFANRLNEIFDGSLIARQADDHFVVLTNKKGVENKCDALNAWVYSYSDETQMGLKVGAFIPDSKEIDPHLACDRARYACNSIKKHYDQDYVEYDKALDDSFQKRQYIVNNVDVALDEGYLRVHYQPVVWAKNRKVCGYEALAKWEDPEMGFISPGEFIPVLEEYRQIHKLDMIVVQTVCKDIRELLDAKKPTVPVSLNFSRLDFELTDVVSILESCVEMYNVPRTYLHVEVTESALSGDLKSLQSDLQKLRDLGYPLWLDDFGSGYSSLNVLKDYEFDVLKIDMKFLSGFEENTVKSKAVLSSVVKLADSLGMRTLTEGVETMEQAEYLKNIGCERLQGYLFGKAMELDKILIKYAAGTLKVSEEFEVEKE